MATLTKQTEADLQRLRKVTSEQLVQALFDIDEEGYGQIVFDTGIAYAKRLTDNDEVGFDFLIRTKFFWAWWKNEWTKRDDEFIETFSADADLSLLFDIYGYQHNIHRLKSDALMQKKTASMVGHAMDEYIREYKKEGAK